jgi:DNA repair exonuclease SbcCD ATPase subunit
MQFQSVCLENFMSYKRADFSIGKPGLYLIEGPNGVGKSSIPDSISWCLFGKTIRGIEGDAIINRKIKNNCKVEVRLTHQAYDYTITRYRKHEEFGNRLMYEKKGTVTHDIKNVEKGTLAITEAALADDLGIDFDLFQCTVLFGQGTTFNFVNESNAEQKKILSKIMKVNFIHQHAKAKEELKSLAGVLFDLDRKLAVLESHKGLPDDFWAQEGDWDMEHKNRIEAAKQLMKTLWDEKSKLEKYLRDRPREKFDSLKVLLADKMTSANKIEATVRETVSDLKGELGTIKSEIARHDKLARALKCPTCESPVSASKCKSQISKLSEKQIQVESEINAGMATLDLILEKKNNYLSKKESISDALYEIQATEGQAELKKKLWTDCKSELEKTRVETNPFTARMEADQEKQRQIIAKIKELTLEVNVLREREPYLKFWVEAFGDNGIKSFIFDVICSGLTEKSNSYLNKLSNGEISISFDTQKKLKSGEVREKFSCEVISDGESVDYKSYSGGEKTRISRSVDLGLSSIMSDQYGSEFNFVVFDEQTSYLNSEGRTSFLSLLKDLAKTQAVYVIDHDDELRAKFDNVIRIEKTKDGSKICERV